MKARTLLQTAGGSTSLARRAGSSAASPPHGASSAQVPHSTSGTSGAYLIHVPGVSARFLRLETRTNGLLRLLFNLVANRLCDCLYIENSVSSKGQVFERAYSNEQSCNLGGGHFVGEVLGGDLL